MLTLRDTDKSWLSALFRNITHSDNISICSEIHLKTQKTSKNILVFEDENYFRNNLCVNKYLNKIIITGTYENYKIFKENNFTCFWSPFLSTWLIHLIPYKQLDTHIELNEFVNTKQFSFLNRNWSQGRSYLIEFLVENHPNLIDEGYITATTFAYYSEYKKFFKDLEFVDFYQTPRNRYFEENNTKIDNIQCSLNLKNAFHIAENIPGKVFITVETEQERMFHTSNSVWGALISEKSLMPFLTKRIPLIIGSTPYVIKLLRDKGFDVFDDVIDHSYDLEPEYFKRLKLAIDLNKENILNVNKIQTYKERLEYNHNFLITDFYQNEVDELKQFLKTVNTRI